MVVASGPHTFDVISAENDAPGPRVIPTGESETLTYTIRNDGVLPVSVFAVPGDGVDMSSTEARIERGGSIETEVTLSAPDRTGYYSRVIVEHWYLGVLPHSTIRSLYAVHSWVPVLVIDFLLGTGFAALATGTVGQGQQRLRDRSREGANAWWPFDG
jgi:signal peptidase